MILINLAQFRDRHLNCTKSWTRTPSGKEEVLRWSAWDFKALVFWLAVALDLGPVGATLLFCRQAKKPKIHVIPSFSLV